jgi:hypothetical protein
MPVTMHVRAAAERLITDPNTGRRVPNDRYVEMMVTSQSMRMVNQGLLEKPEVSLATPAEDANDAPPADHKQGARASKRGSATVSKTVEE